MPEPLGPSGLSGLGRNSKAAAGPALWGHSPFGTVPGLMSPGGPEIPQHPPLTPSGCHRGIPPQAPHSARARGLPAPAAAGSCEVPVATGQAGTAGTAPVSGDMGTILVSGDMGTAPVPCRGHGDSAGALPGPQQRAPDSQPAPPKASPKREETGRNGKRRCSPSLLGHCGGRLPRERGKGQAPCREWSGHGWPVAPARLLRATPGCLPGPNSLGMPRGHPLLPRGGHQCPGGMEMGWAMEVGWGSGAGLGRGDGLGHGGGLGKWSWVGPWRWAGDVEMGWGRGDGGQSQHRSSQAGASPSLETRAGPGHAHPWDTPLPSRHRHPPMGHATRGQAGGAQGHQGHTHPCAITAALLMEPEPRWCGGTEEVVAGALGDPGSADARCWGQLSTGGGCVSHAAGGSSRTAGCLPPAGVGCCHTGGEGGSGSGAGCGGGARSCCGTCCTGTGPCCAGSVGCAAALS